MEPHHSAEIFPHIRIVMGTVIGLGITRLLMTIAGIIQHPQRAKRSSLHLLWLGSILIELVLFWWWEFSLFQLPSWSFGIVLFILCYAITLFMLTALLSPDNISDYNGYEDFFLRRRHWFFGLLATTFVFDAVDTAIKGIDHWNSYQGSYFIQVPVGLVLAAIAWRSTDRRVHLGIVTLHICYQIFLTMHFFNLTY